MRPVVAITLGDYNGIGPEVILKSLRNRAVRGLCTPLLVGPEDAFAFYAERLGEKRRWIPFTEGAARRSDTGPSPVYLSIPDGLRRSRLSPGTVSSLAGRTAVRTIEHASGLISTGSADALVTGPLSKKAIHRGGIRLPGQTELLQMLSSSRRVAMMLVSDPMRIGLVTIHVPVREVAHLLSRSLLRQKIEVVHDALVKDWRIPRPRIAVLGLNPHAGEDGDIGWEEKTIVSPIIRSLKSRSMRVDGPFPADAFFSRYSPGIYDAVIAMYHDQGLIPLKMIASGKGVNITAGLPFIRTSPAHGTAFDIAGHGKADARSMIEAITLAARLTLNRRAGKPRRTR
ncbi:MAG: 4-hydroxythreonine-4-phosphate dehydrogenase PdxA [Bacteroidota bacterium]